MRYAIPICFIIIINGTMALFAFTVADWSNAWDADGHLLNPVEVSLIWASESWYRYWWLFFAITVVLVFVVDAWMSKPRNDE